MRRASTPQPAYRGVAPMVSLGKEYGPDPGPAFHQTECFEAWMRPPPRHVPPETSHAIRGAIVEGLRLQGDRRGKMPLYFDLSRHGLCDMTAYEKFLLHPSEDYAYPQEKIPRGIGPPVLA